MRVTIEAIAERIRSSFFFVPMLFVIAGVVLGELGVTLDEAIGHEKGRLPLRFTSTVDSGRLVLSVVAGATITFASIAFSVSLLIISLTSSQYSPRVVHGLFRDRFNKRVIGLVVGTFAYCLVVIRSVRGPLEEGGTPLIPSLSVAFAVFLGLAAILSIVAFINHSAHSMDISKILHRITAETNLQAERLWIEPGEGDEPDEADAIDAPKGEGFVVTFGQDGWLQQLDEDALLAAAAPDGIIRIDTRVGRYAMAHAPLCTIWPVPEDPDEACRLARQATEIGEARTMQQDVTYGVRQLADIALKALSPGVNDPTTAQDAIFHLGSVASELLRRRPPWSQRTVSGNRTVLDPHRVVYEDIVSIAFDEVRLAAHGQPAVQMYLLEVLSLLDTTLSLPPDDDRAQLVRRQADLILEGSRDDRVLASDRSRVEEAYHRRFGSDDSA